MKENYHIKHDLTLSHTSASPPTLQSPNPTFQVPNYGCLYNGNGKLG